MIWPTSPEFGAESCVEGEDGICEGGRIGCAWDVRTEVGSNWAKSRPEEKITGPRKMEYTQRSFIGDSCSGLV
jgi:hypothetical protein